MRKCDNEKESRSADAQVRIYRSPIVSLSPFLVFFFLLCPSSFAQQSLTDSLLSLVKKDKEDTSKVNHLNALAWEYKYTNPDSTILLAKQAVALCDKLLPQSTNYLINQLTIKKANAYGTAGIGYWEKGDYPKALENHFAALKLDEALNNKKGMAKRLGNIGLVYWNQADYPKALDYYFRALKMDEELGNSPDEAIAKSSKNGIARHLGNIGIVYYNQADYPKALDYYFRALKMTEELGDKNRIAIWLDNIGIIYMEQASAASPDSAVYRDRLFTKALDYYFRALKMAEELGNKKGMATRLGNIGLVYMYQADYPKALDYYFRALKMAEELGDKNGIARHLGNIGSLYTKTGKFKEAEEYLKHSLALCDSIGALEHTKQFELCLSQLYDTLAQLSAAGKTLTGFGTLSGLQQLAFTHYKKYITARDSINSEENQKKQVRTEMNYEFEKKEAAAKAEAAQQAAVAAAESKKQKMVIWLVMVILLVVAVFAAFIYRALRITQKQKKIIEAQKKLVEEKQKEILDSIHYAKRIQTALLPTEKYIEKNIERLRAKMPK